MRTTWILIANASEARLFATEKTPKDMRLIHEFHHPESREKGINLVSDGSGRYRSAGAGSGVYEVPTNPKQVEAERFAHQLATELNQGRNKNLYKNLVLIAPSQFQGLLNKFCNPHVKNLIINTLDKDYTKLKQHELFDYLNGKIHIRRVA